MSSLKNAIDFHGHLGPYLILGLRAGELALKELHCKKYFGLKVNVYGANKKPQSCLIDGLQLSTGATYGKGNIQKHAAKSIKIEFINLQDNKKLQIFLKGSLLKRLASLNSHADSEEFAKRLLKINNRELFELKQ